MLGLIGLIFRGICGVHDYIDNQQTIKRTTTLQPDGSITYFDNNYAFYRNNEIIWQKSFKDINGKMHYQEIGSKTKRIYKDSFEEQAKEQLAENERNKQEALKQGKNAYMAWHPYTPLTEKHLTEISTGKLLDSIMRDEDGNSKKMYFEFPESRGWTTDVCRSTDVWIPISCAEFDTLKVPVSSRHCGKYCYDRYGMEKWAFDFNKPIYTGGKDK